MQVQILDDLLLWTAGSTSSEESGSQWRALESIAEFNRST